MVKVWVNGSFDILHIGHIRLFGYAKYFDSDSYIWKGDSQK